MLAYVSGEKKGLILETPYEMGKSLYQTTSLNIETERIVVEETLNELRNNGGTEERTTLAMKQLGLKRYGELHRKSLEWMCQFNIGDETTIILLSRFLFRL